MTKPSPEALAEGKKLIGALVIMHGMGIHADRLAEAENEAALVIDRAVAQERRIAESEREARHKLEAARTASPNSANGYWTYGIGRTLNDHD